MPDILDNIESQQSARLKQAAEDDMLLAAELRDIELWKKNARHTPKWLREFLKYNIAEILYRPTGAPRKIKVVCTLSKPLIEAMGAPGESEKETVKQSRPFRVYDMESRSYKTINLDGWRVLRFVTMITENAELLESIVENCRR